MATTASVVYAPGTSRGLAVSPAYVSLLAPDAGQRKHELREVFNAVRWLRLPHVRSVWLDTRRQTIDAALATIQRA